MAVTGPRTGATGNQLITAVRLIYFHGVCDMHNGDAIGVDHQLYHIGRAADCKVHLHPPTNHKFRAFNGDRKDMFYPEKGFFERDRDMVDASNFLAAFPDTRRVKLHSGTWYTIGYAQSINKPIVFVWRDGSFDYENWPSDIRMPMNIIYESL